MEYVLGVVAAALLGTSFVLQQGAAQRLPTAEFLHLRLIADLLRQPRWLAGIGTMICGQLLSAWVIGHLVLAVSEPLLATNLLIAVSLAWPLSGQRLRASEIVGALVLLAGVVALALAQSVPATHETIGSPRYWPISGGIVAAVAAGLALAGRRTSGEMRAVLTGTGAGVLFGVQDALTRRTILGVGSLHQIGAMLTSWPVYSLIIAGVAGLWLMQNAFNSAPLHASLPAITATEPVCGMVLGFMVFRQQVPTSAGMIALQVAGVVALVAGVVTLARAPALSAIHPTAAIPHRPRQGSHPARESEVPSAVSRGRWWPRPASASRQATPSAPPSNRFRPAAIRLARWAPDVLSAARARISDPDPAE